MTRTPSKLMQREERIGPSMEFWRLFWRTLGYMRPYRRYRNFLVGITALRGAQLMAVTWTFTAVINGPVARMDPSGILWGALGFAAVALFTQVIFGVRIFTALKIGEQVTRDMRRELFAHLQRMTAHFYHHAEVGKLISRMTADIEQVRLGVQDVCFISVVNLLQLGFAAILMAWTDLVLFGVAIAIGPVFWVANQVYREKMSHAQRHQSESFSKVSAAVSESVDGVRVTQGFVRQEFNTEIFRELVADHSRNIMKASKANALFLPFLEFNTQLFVALLLVVGSYRVLYHQVPLSTVLQFLFMAGLFFDPIRTLAAQYNQAFASLVGAERLFRLLDEKPDWEDAADAVDLPLLQGRVELRGVSFSYEGAREGAVSVLRGIDLVAEPGQTIALVGHTGSGKSSIINLLTKAYLPTLGEITYDGHEVREIRSESLRRQLGIVQQKNFLFTGTLMENIRFSRPSATDDEVLDAARALDFYDLIEAMPQGFATPVGEGGNGLSVGQRQVVCFLRAWLAQPRLLILDEATSAIDAITEARLQKALEILLCGRTSFVVAHRLSTIVKADVILVLDHGEIVERGTHAELLARGGIYHSLHEQFVQNTGGAKRDAKSGNEQALAGG